jgi:hypothetical protein
MHQFSTIIGQIRMLPAALRALVAPLTDAQLASHPILGEWSVAQTVHHLADSHLHGYIRCKRIITEDVPTLVPYDPDTWSLTTDAQGDTIDGSLAIIEGLHARWADSVEAIDAATWERTGFHPEVGELSLELLVDLYVAHGVGHLDQITRTIAAMT